MLYKYIYVQFDISISFNSWDLCAQTDKPMLVYPIWMIFKHSKGKQNDPIENGNNLF